jgi:hypothetical protein
LYSRYTISSCTAPRTSLCAAARTLPK